MVIEQELRRSLHYDSETWTNKEYLAILDHFFIDFLSRFPEARVFPNVIDSFASSYEKNPYRRLAGKYLRFCEIVHNFLFGGTRGRNYINEATLLKVIRNFLYYCNFEQRKYTIKRVPCLVWAVSTQNVNLVCKIKRLMQDVGIMWHLYDESLNINISLDRLNKKKEFLREKFNSGNADKFDILQKMRVLYFIEEYNHVTPLILACKLKNIKMATFLIRDRGYNVGLSDKDMFQKNAYDYAVENNLLQKGRFVTELAEAWHYGFVWNMGGIFTRCQT